MPHSDRTSPARPLARLAGLSGSLFARILLSLVVVSVALAAVLAIVLTDSASTALSSQARQAKQAAARSVARDASSWIAVRRQDARSMAAELGDRGAGRSALARLESQFPEFSGAWLYSPTGRRTLAAGAGIAPAVTAATPWFAAARGAGTGVSDVADVSGHGAMYLAAPVRTAGGGSAVLVVATPTATLAPLVAGVAPGRTGEAFIADGAHRLIASSLAGAVPLTTRVVSAAATRGLAGATGSLVYRDYQGHQAVGAYAPVAGLDWVVVVKQDTSVAFAAISHQRELALILILAGLLAALVVAYVVARALSRPLVELQRTATAVAGGDLSARVVPSGATENRRLGESFNAMLGDVESLLAAVRAAGEEMTSSSTELSAAAEQLASATNQQSSASTETSATMEELARTSATIAEHADGAAERCVETQATLREAEEGMRASSERTMALAKQVDEISSILELINSIADKTAVLSLNAAIEAARAGESGAGFTVVSEEVGRLAERSKASAAHISEIVRATQQDATATVMAMEAGGKQMRRGLELMEEVTTAASQVQLTTQQQRTATVQVVDTMASLSESTRQTSATTQQIAESAANLSSLSADLRRSAAAVRGDGSADPVDRPRSTAWERAIASEHADADRVLVGAGRNGHGA